MAFKSKTAVKNSVTSVVVESVLTDISTVISIMNKFLSQNTLVMELNVFASKLRQIDLLNDNYSGILVEVLYIDRVYPLLYESYKK